jgi:hypothetical protein
MAANDVPQTEYLNLLVRLTMHKAAKAASLRLTPLTCVLRQASLQPEQAVNVLNDRVNLINKINSDIADWLQVGAFCARTWKSALTLEQERRKVEEAYVIGLRKLARRPQQDAAVALGYEQPCLRASESLMEDTAFSRCPGSASCLAPRISQLHTKPSPQKSRPTSSRLYGPGQHEIERSKISALHK